MDYKVIDKTSYKLHLIKTNKFKTMTIRICFRDEIKKDEITLRNFLASFMTYSTGTYKTKRDLILKTQDLYAASIYNRSYRSGRYSVFNFYLSFLDEKYTEKGMLNSSLELLSDVIFNPNFDEESSKEAYSYLMETATKKLESIKENGNNYSVIRMFEEMDKDMPYSYRDVGYLEDLKNISINSLKEYYKKVINSSLIDIYIIGDIDKSIGEKIEKYFPFNTYKHNKVDQIIYHEKMPKRSKTIKENDNNNQSKLSIGCKIDALTEFERNYVLTLYNMILGSGSESKFFQIIREKNSLAYYVYSSLNKLDSLMIIRAGIAKENFDMTVKLVKDLMKEMENGKFSEEDINVACENYISMLSEIEDNPDAIVETYLAKDLLNLGDIEERKEEIRKVTKEDIINISKKVKIDTIFLLEGDGQLE